MNTIDTFYTAPTIVGNPLKAGKIALHDADYLKYLVVDRVWKEGQENGGNYPKPDQIIQDLISNLLMKIHDPILYCFSGKSYETFRYYSAFEKEYKGNRKGREDYRDYPGKIEDSYYVVEYICKKFNALIFKDLEADDVVSALQCENTYIISKDKDLKQIPGFHYHFEKNNLYEVTNEDAVYLLCLQLLMGDSTDNIPGLPGIGEKRAADILKEVRPQQMIKRVLHEYQVKYGQFLGTDMFNEMWMLVKLRPNRGEHFKQKYKEMFDMKEFLLNNLK